jgi:hypothetical protein
MDFSGDAVTVYSKWTNGILVVSKIATYREDRFKDCQIIAHADVPTRESFSLTGISATRSAHPCT